MGLKLLRPYCYISLKLLHPYCDVGHFTDPMIPGV